jgi:hypothetical protein
MRSGLSKLCPNETARTPKAPGFPSGPAKVARGLKIPVSVVRFRPWAPFSSENVSHLSHWIALLFALVCPNCVQTHFGLQALGEELRRQLGVDALEHPGVGVSHRRRDALQRGAGGAQPGRVRAAEIVRRDVADGPRGARRIGSGPAEFDRRLFPEESAGGRSRTCHARDFSSPLCHLSYPGVLECVDEQRPLDVRHDRHRPPALRVLRPAQQHRRLASGPRAARSRWRGARRRSPRRTPRAPRRPPPSSANSLLSWSCERNVFRGLVPGREPRHRPRRAHRTRSRAASPASAPSGGRRAPCRCCGRRRFPAAG